MGVPDLNGTEVIRQIAGRVAGYGRFRFGLEVQAVCLTIPAYLGTGDRGSHV